MKEHMEQEQNVRIPSLTVVVYLAVAVVVACALVWLFVAHADLQRQADVQLLNTQASLEALESRVGTLRGMFMAHADLHRQADVHLLDTQSSLKALESRVSMLESVTPVQARRDVARQLREWVK